MKYRHSHPPGSLELLKNENKFNKIWNETMNVCVINNNDEPDKHRRRKDCRGLDGGDVVTTTIPVKDYRINFF